MLQHQRSAPGHDPRIQSAPAPAVQIVSSATALPPHPLSQAAMLERAREVFPHLAHLEPVYANTGIAERYACMPLDWYVAEHGWKTRGEVFAREAPALLEEAARAAMTRADLGPRDIDAIVTVSTTGICVPSLDAMLMNRLDFSPDTERLPIFGLGCAAGVTGLARSARLAQSMGEANVLLLAVELCSLNFRLSDPSKAMFISTALFGDGAAALILRGTPQPSAAGHAGGWRASVLASGEHLWRESEDLMGWSIEEDGFGVVISTRIPAFARANLASAARDFLAKSDLCMADLDGFILHPGGRKVLEGMAAAFDIEEERLRHSWDVLRDCGNMSSPTVLFVLERTLQAGARGLHLMAALGPGFTVSFALLEL